MISNDNYFPDFIGIGDQKSATSWIFKCLLEHPGICGFKNKETRFFDDDYLYRQGLDKYEEFFEHCSQDKVVGEYSPSYIHSEKALQRIGKDFPETKIIISFRNPVDKIISAYSYNKVSGSGEMMKYDSLKEAIQNEESLLTRAHHGDNLERVYEYFSKDQVFVGFYDDLDENPKKFMSDLFEFLGVDPDFIPEGVTKKYHVTGGKYFRFPFIMRWIVKIKNQLDRSSVLKNTVISLGGKVLYNEFRRSFVVEGSEHKRKRKKVSVDEETRKEIISLLSDDIKKLEEITGRDLSHWK